MFSKKASWVGLVLHPLFETAIALGIVLLYLLWFIHGIGETATYEKRFLSTDIPLLMDSILAMPQKGNLYALYNPQRSTDFSTNYSFSFLKNQVIIMAGPADKKQVTGYYTSKPGIYVQEKQFIAKDAMIVPLFILQGNDLLIDNANKRELTYNRNIMPCSGPRFPGTLSIQGENAAAQLLLGQRWAVKSGGSGAFSMQIKQGQETVVKAYFNAEQPADQLAQSRRIACEVANAAVRGLDKIGIDVAGSAFIPINPKHTGSTDDDFLQGLGVLLEIDTPEKLDNVQTQVTPLALAVGEGVQNAKS